MKEHTVKMRGGHTQHNLTHLQTTWNFEKEEEMSVDTVFGLSLGSFQGTIAVYKVLERSIILK